MRGLMRKALIISVFALFTFVSFIGGTNASFAFNIEVANNLSVATYKTFQFTVNFDSFSNNTQFALLDGASSLPLEIISRKGTSILFESVAKFKPLEHKTLHLEYGDDVKTNYNTIFQPDFIGNKFLGVGNGTLYIVSFAENNPVKVIDSSNNELYSGTLNANETKEISLKNNSIFRVNSSKPVLVEVSSLMPDYLNNSSDDISSVYGTYFKLFIPRELFVSTVSETNLKVVDEKGNIVFEGKLPERGVYQNLSLKGGFYTIVSDNPVTMQFGCAEDNIYTVSYGGVSEFKGFCFGDVAVSSLYPDTAVSIKTQTATKSINLKNPGDFYLDDVIKNFKEKITEFAPIYITYSKPIFIYSNENFGNLGGESIPSVNGDGETFIFRTGKVYNFNGITHKRQVVVIADSDGTELTLNGNKLTLNALDSKTFEFSDSFSIVNVTSSKTISVFETGLGTDKEFFSVIIPLENKFSLSSPIVSTTPGNPQQGISNTQQPSNGIISTVKGIIGKVGSFFASAWAKVSNLKWVDNAINGIKKFWSNMVPLFKDLSKRIINLFYPASEFLFPYISKALPQVTKEEISAGIFLVLITLLVILIIPKRRKKRTIPTVPIGELKKRSLDFNVITLEEKGATSDFFRIEEEKPLTINKNKSVEQTTTDVENIGVISKPVLSAKDRVKVESKVQEKESIKLPSLRKPGRKEPTKPIAIEQPPLTQIPVPEVTPSLQSTLKEETPSFADFGQPGEEALLKASADEETQTPTIQSKQDRSTVEQPSSQGAQKSFVSKLKEKISQESNVGQENETILPKIVEKIEVSTTRESEAPEIVEKIEPSTFDVLFEKLKSQEKEIAKAPESLRMKDVGKVENAQEIKQEPKIAEVPTKKVFEHGFVGDSESVTRILASSLDERQKKVLLSRVYISAQAKSLVSDKLSPTFTIGVIALTPIEQRIAADIGKRIKGSPGTGEAILIAKKIRVFDVVVNDRPLITNYQGININNIDDVL